MRLFGQSRQLVAASPGYLQQMGRSLQQLFEGAIGSTVMASTMATRVLGAVGNELLINAINQYHGMEVFNEEGRFNTEEAATLASTLQFRLDRDFEDVDVTMLEKEPPEEFICPITLTIMKDPVRVVTIVSGTPQAHYFEREAIEKWQERSHENPMNRQPIESVEPAPDLEARILRFLKDPKNYKQSNDSVAGTQSLATEGGSSTRREDLPTSDSGGSSTRREDLKQRSGFYKETDTDARRLVIMQNRIEDLEGLEKEGELGPAGHDELATLRREFKKLKDQVESRSDLDFHSPRP